MRIHRKMHDASLDDLYFVPVFLKSDIISDLFLIFLPLRAGVITIINSGMSTICLIYLT